MMSNTPLDPPMNGGDSGAVAAPQDGPAADLYAEDVFSDNAFDAGPSVTPPTEAVAADEIGATAWHNNKRITSMWCNASNKNAYAAIQGVGWRRISPANDSAWLSMTMLASLAEQTGARANILLGDDNMIREIYVW